MKDVRLAAFDLDGTLLDSANKISDFTIRQIQKAIDRGIEIVIATGRSVPLFPEELKRVSGIRYAIVENGAGIYDLKIRDFFFAGQFHMTSCEKSQIVWRWPTGLQNFFQKEMYIPILKISAV